MLKKCTEFSDTVITKLFFVLCILCSPYEWVVFVNDHKYNFCEGPIFVKPL